MLKKNTLIFFIVGIIIIVAIIIGFMVYNNNSNNQNNYVAQKTSTENNSNENINNNTNSLSEQNNVAENPNTNVIVEIPEKKIIPVEEEISSFSTKISNKDSARQNNIRITCNAITNTVIENGQTFSFCNTVGPSTTAKGYQEADIFDANGNKKKGLGGGNCQISTTLYNAVLDVPDIKVTQRHAHSNYVPYVQKGKDAAVAYGSYDLKFVNNTGNAIKLKVETNSDVIVATIIKITNVEQ